MKIQGIHCGQHVVSEHWRENSEAGEISKARLGYVLGIIQWIYVGVSNQKKKISHLGDIMYSGYILKLFLKEGEWTWGRAQVRVEIEGPGFEILIFNV